MTLQKNTTNQPKHVQYEAERRRRFIMRMERKLAMKQRSRTFRYVPRNWNVGYTSDNIGDYKDLLG